MTITLELPPEAEAQLWAEIRRRDADGVQRLLAQALAPTVAALLHQTADELSDSEFEATADRLADEFAACRPFSALSLSEFALSRAGIYQDHP